MQHVGWHDHYRNVELLFLHPSLVAVTLDALQRSNCTLVGLNFRHWLL